MKKQLDEMSNSLTTAQNLLLKMEEQNDVHVVNILQVELTNSKLTEQLKSQEKMLKETNQLLQVRETQYKKDMNEVRV